MLKKFSMVFIMIIFLLASTGCSNNSNIISNSVEYLVSFEVVNESNSPIEGAVITLEGESKTTNVSGVTSFNKSNGTYNYTISSGGYEETSNSITISDSDTTVNVTLIEESTVIFEENFTGVTINSSSWSTSHPNYWSIENTNYAGGLSPEAYFDCRIFDSSSQLVSPEINASEYSEELIIDFKQYINPYTPVQTGYSLSLKYKINGSSSWITLWSITPTDDDIGPTTVTVDLTNDLSEEIFELAWVFEGVSWKLYEWRIDDIVITAR